MFRVFSFVVVTAGLACAQETVYHASVSGYVNDPSGAVVQNARVMARQAETNISTETVTNKDGRFRFPYLKVGPYTVTVQQPGFADDSRSLVLGIGGAYEVSFALMIAGAETSVNVDANAAVLETARSQIAGTVALPATCAENSLLTDLVFGHQKWPQCTHDSARNNLGALSVGMNTIALEVAQVFGNDLGEQKGNQRQAVFRR